MTNAIATQPDHAEVIEQVVIAGDLARLNPAQRVTYYRQVCDSLGLNPFTRPFDYITLNGKLTLYAKRDAADQLRKLHGVSVQIVSRERMEDVFVVTAHAAMPDGRSDESIGAVTIGNLKGDALANALMKAETKAKRRVTLSIVGLGWLDETEIETIRDARPAIVDTETGEILTGNGKKPEPATITAQANPRTPEQLREHLRNSAHADANKPELTVGWRDGLIGTIDKMTEPNGHHAFLAWAFGSATGSRKDMTNGQIHALKGWLQTHSETQIAAGENGEREEKKVWVLNELPAAELLAAYPIAKAAYTVASDFPAAADLHPESAHLEA